MDRSRLAVGGFLGPLVIPPRCWENLAAVVFRSALGSPTSAISPVLIAIAIQVGSIVCRSMTFGAFAKMCRFDR